MKNNTDTIINKFPTAIRPSSNTFNHIQHNDQKSKSSARSCENKKCERQNTNADIHPNCHASSLFAGGVLKQLARIKGSRYFADMCGMHILLFQRAALADANSRGKSVPTASSGKTQNSTAARMAFVSQTSRPSFTRHTAKAVPGTRR